MGETIYHLEGVIGESVKIQLNSKIFCRIEEACLGVGETFFKFDCTCRNANFLFDTSENLHSSNNRQ